MNFISIERISVDVFRAQHRVYAMKFRADWHRAVHKGQWPGVPPLVPRALRNRAVATPTTTLPKSSSSPIIRGRLSTLYQTHLFILEQIG